MTENTHKVTWKQTTKRHDRLVVVGESLSSEGFNPGSFVGRDVNSWTTRTNFTYAFVPVYFRLTHHRLCR